MSSTFTSHYFFHAAVEGCIRTYTCIYKLRCIPGRVLCACVLLRWGRSSSKLRLNPHSASILSVPAEMRQQLAHLRCLLPVTGGYAHRGVLLSAVKLLECVRDTGCALSARPCAHPTAMLLRDCRSVSYVVIAAW